MIGRRKSGKISLVHHILSICYIWIGRWDSKGSIAEWGKCSFTLPKLSSCRKADRTKLWGNCLGLNKFEAMREKLKIWNVNITSTMLPHTHTHTHQAHILSFRLLVSLFAGFTSWGYLISKIWFLLLNSECV